VTILQNANRRVAGRPTELQAQWLGLAAFGYDPVETLAAFSRQLGITFPLLSDAGSETIKRYGILNTVVDEALGPHKDDPAIGEETQKYVSAVGVNPIMKGIAFPGTFIIDRRGRVTSRFFENFLCGANHRFKPLV
jgi:peroxiredoxin